MSLGFPGPARGLLVIVLAVSLLAPAGAGASFHEQPPSSGNGWDCGRGWDSTWQRKVRMYSGDECDGNLDQDPAWPPEDYYEYWATDADVVQIDFWTRNCAVWWQRSHPYGGWTQSSQGSETYLVAGDGWTYIRVWEDAFSGFSPEPDYHGQECNEQPRDYTVWLWIYPNDRPAPSVVSAPSTVLPGEPYGYTFRATDADGNLMQVGLDAGSGLTWEYVASGSADERTYTLSLDSSRTLFFHARDTYGAEDWVAHAVEVREDDCGSGGDVGTADAAFPFSCRAHLWPPIGDYEDVWRFDVPVGTERVYAGYDLVSGNLSTRLTLLAPDGTVASEAVDASQFVAAEPGTWTLRARREAGKGRYEVDVRGIGAPAPPVLDAAVPKTSIHQGETLTVTLSADDPNALPVTYEVDWGDGTAPGTAKLASGETGTLSHLYRENVTDPVLTVVATNEEGLSDSASFVLSVTLHDDCGFGPGYDAPFTREGDVREVAGECTGSLGFPPLDGYPYGFDDVDYYRTRVTGLRSLRVTVEPEAGLIATVFVEGPGGVRIGATPLDRETVFLPTTVPGTYFIGVENLHGKGAYLLRVEREPPP